MPADEFRRLTERIPSEFIKNPPQGKHGKYVSHDDIEQIALGKLGRPVSFEVVDMVRGYIPEWVSSSGKKSNPERPMGIVGCLARLTAIIDGHEYTITEVGEANSPEVHSDGENLKTAASDAYKRCWMRFGLGLELWVEQGQNPSKYFLHTQIEKNVADTSPTSSGQTDVAPSEGITPPTDPVKGSSGPWKQCPKCGYHKIWDNRAENSKRRADPSGPRPSPDFRCRNDTCKWDSWKQKKFEESQVEVDPLDDVEPLDPERIF